MIGRAEQVDEAGAMSSTYACQNCCGDFVEDVFISPSSVNMQVGQNTTLQAFEVRSDCYGFTYPVQQSASWSSSNTSVATVSGGQVTSIGGGQTTITASWTSFTSVATQCEPGSGIIGPGPIEPAPCCNSVTSFRSASASVTVQGIDVSIEAFLGVGKDQTVNVQVTLTPSPTQGNVTLILSTISGTGAARFASNNSTMLTINQSTSVGIKGMTESSTADNIRLEARVGNVSHCTEDFSVVLVTLSLRTGTGNSVSMDNFARAVYIACIGSANLGTFRSNGTICAQMWRTNVEIIGTVKPSNYIGTVMLEREIVAKRTYDNMTLLAPVVDNEPDNSIPDFLDDDPQSGGSNGKVYDLDGPGVTTGSSVPLNGIIRRRQNFRQWATIDPVRAGDPRIRASADFNWFYRLSIIKTANGDQLQSDLPGDNTAGGGTTKITWNFQ